MKPLLTFLFAAFVSHCFSQVANAQTAAHDDPPLEPLTNQSDRSWLFAERIAAPAIAGLRSDSSGSGGGASYLPSKFAFPDDAIYDNQLGAPRKRSIFGIDVSHYTNSIAFEKLRDEGVRFVYAKATQGIRFKDGKFAQHWSELGKTQGDNKLLRGAYHFLSAGLDGKEQAKVFLAFVNLNGGFRADDLPPVLDLEWDVSSPGGPDAWREMSPSATMDEARDWLNYVKQATGREPIIYTARSWVAERGLQSEFQTLEGFRIWTADYSRSGLAVETPAAPGKRTPDLWQFSERATAPASYSGSLDANIFKGTEEEFARFAQQ